MTRYWTSDFHFGHENIIKFCDRPFDDVHEMNEFLIKNWNEQVGPLDEVWFIGDLAMGKLLETLPLAKRLNGRKVLIPGNHDSCWKGKKGDKTVPVYLAVGFDRVDQAPIYCVLEDDETTVLVNHFPYSGDSHPEDRFTEYRSPDKGSWLIHGHVHDAWRQRGRQINVGIDAWGGHLVSDTELIALIKAGPQDRDCISWVMGSHLKSDRAVS